MDEDPLSSLVEDLKIWDQNVTSGFQEVTTSASEHQCQQILEVVPSASLEEVRESLYQCGGDLEQAVENLMDRMVLQETSQSHIKGELDFQRSPDSQVELVFFVAIHIFHFHRHHSVFQEFTFTNFFLRILP